MALNANEQPRGGSPIDPLDPGSYPARTVLIVDLGLQAQAPFQGKEKDPVRMVSITYEFVDEFLKDEEGNELTDKPRWLSEMFAFYNLTADKAKSTSRYKALDPANTYKGDFSKLVNIPCMVTVVHNPGKGKNAGRIYENIGDVSPMREKDAVKCPPLVNPPLVFDLDAPDLAVFNALPQYLQTKIKSNLEFEGSALQTLLGGTPAKVATKKTKPAEPVVEEDETPY